MRNVAACRQSPYSAREFPGYRGRRPVRGEQSRPGSRDGDAPDAARALGERGLREAARLTPPRPLASVIFAQQRQNGLDAGLDPGDSAFEAMLTILQAAVTVFEAGQP